MVASSEGSVGGADRATRRQTRSMDSSNSIGGSSLSDSGLGAHVALVALSVFLSCK